MNKPLGIELGRRVAELPIVIRPVAAITEWDLHRPRMRRPAVTAVGQTPITEGEYRQTPPPLALAPCRIGACLRLTTAASHAAHVAQLRVARQATGSGPTGVPNESLFVSRGSVGLFPVA